MNNGLFRTEMILNCTYVTKFIPFVNYAPIGIDVCRVVNRLNIGWPIFEKWERHISKELKNECERFLLYISVLHVGLDYKRLVAKKIY